MITVNHKIKKSVWNRVFKPKGGFRAMYKYSDDRETIRVSNGHWLFKLPTCAIPTEFLGFLSGDDGIYTAGGNTGACAPDFDAVMVMGDRLSKLRKTEFYHKLNGTETALYVDSGGDIFPVDRAYTEMIYDIFPDASLHGEENTSAIKLYSGEDEVGLVMPVAGAGGIKQLLKDIVLAKETD